MGYDLSTAVIGGLIVAAILFVGGLLVRRFVPNWANAIMYAIGISAVGLFIYVLFLALGQFQNKDPVSHTVEEKVSQWLGEAGYGQLPLSIPTDSNTQFHINFQYAKDFTVNVTINKKFPHFLNLGIIHPIAVDQIIWWDSKTKKEQQQLLHGLMLEIGMDPAVGFEVIEAKMGGVRSVMLKVTRLVPIDASLNRPWFFRDVEFVVRYLRTLRFSFNQAYERETNGSR